MWTIFLIQLFNVDVIVIVEAIVIEVRSVESSEMKKYSMVLDNCLNYQLKIDYDSFDDYNSHYVE